MALGKLLLIIAAFLGIIGLILIYAPWLLNWFGKLPGDIRIEGKNSFFFFPITSMIIVSIIISIIINLFFRGS